MIVELAKRLGVTSDRAIRKAQEFERLLHLKTAASGFHIQGAAQMVLCLDLAVSMENQTLDKDLSLKLSGLKKPAYNATKQTIKQMLGLNKDLTIKDICVQLGCVEIVQDAENLLSKYQEQQICREQQDLNHPCFKSASIMALSKMKKLGVDKSKLQELSGLKKSVFDRLVGSLVELQKQLQQVTTPQAKQSKRTHSFLEAVEAKAIALEKERSSLEDNQALPEVDFAAWKRRMLEEAKSQ